MADVHFPAPRRELLVLKDPLDEMVLLAPR